MADKIDKLELFHVAIPLPTPFYPAWIPGFPETDRNCTLLRVTTHEGLIGHATGLAYGKEREGLGDFIGRFLLGLDPTDAPSAARRIREASFLGWRNNWMETAFWDLAAQAQGIPVWQLLQNHVLDERNHSNVKRSSARPSVYAYASFAEYRPPIARMESLERAQAAGFRGAKIVLRGQNEAEDLAQLRSARQSVGENFALMAHAHQAWNVALLEDVPKWAPERAHRLAAEAAQRDFLWLQEPFHVDDIEAQRRFVEKAPIFLAGGDIANGHSVLQYLARSHSVNVLTPDVSFSGLDACTKLMVTAKRQNIELSPSCYGDGVSLAANLHLATAWMNYADSSKEVWLEYPWEPPAMVPQFRDALLSSPLEIERDGSMKSLTKPGLGIEIDEKMLQKYGERFYSLTPVKFAVSTARRSGLRQTAAFARNPRRSSS
ncbi:MAG: enolase C-terminal domain-like protein [Myxococcota bacterium]|nr:enolase C-terminal domain-like protein [Myxococcota bacterium]